jgi:hypothetical protein
MADEGDDDDDAVGYGRPPKKHRFKPGQSGNPAGRKRGARGVKAQLREQLNEMVEIHQNGRARKVPMKTVVLKSLIAKAAKGDWRAADRVVQYMIQVEGLEDQRDQGQRLSAADEQLLNRLLGEGPSDEAQPDDKPGKSKKD